MNIKFNCDFPFDLKYERARIINGDLKKNHNWRYFALMVWVSLVFGAIPWFLGYRVLGAIVFALWIVLSLFPIVRINRYLKALEAGDGREKETYVTLTDNGVLIEHNRSEHRHPWESFDSYYDGTLGCHLFLDQVNGFTIPYTEIEKHIPSREFMDLVKSKVPKAYRRANMKRQ